MSLLLRAFLTLPKNLGPIFLGYGVLTLLMALTPIDVFGPLLREQTLSRHLSPALDREQLIRVIEKMLLSLATALSLSHFLTLREASVEETARHNWLYQFPVTTWRIWLTESVISLFKRGKVICLALITLGVSGALASDMPAPWYLSGHEILGTAPALSLHQSSLLQLPSPSHLFHTLPSLALRIILILATITHATALAAVLSDFLQLRNRSRAIPIVVVLLILAAQLFANNLPATMLARLIAQDGVAASEIGVSLLCVYVTLTSACRSRCRWARRESYSNVSSLLGARHLSLRRCGASPWLLISWTISPKQVVSALHLLAIVRHKPLALEMLTAILLGPILLAYNFDFANLNLHQSNNDIRGIINPVASSIVLATVLSYASVGLLLLTTRVALGMLPWFLHDHRWLIRAAPNGEVQAVSGITRAWVAVSGSIVLPTLIYGALSIGLTLSAILAAVILTLAANYLTVSLTQYAGILLKGASCAHPHDVAHSVSSSIASVVLGFIIGSLNATTAIAITTPSLLFGTTHHSPSSTASIMFRGGLIGLMQLAIVFGIVAIVARLTTLLLQRCCQKSSHAVLGTQAGRGKIPRES